MVPRVVPVQAMGDVRLGIREYFCLPVLELRGTFHVYAQWVAIDQVLQCFHVVGGCAGKLKFWLRRYLLEQRKLNGKAQLRAVVKQAVAVQGFGAKRFNLLIGFSMRCQLALATAMVSAAVIRNAPTERPRWMPTTDAKTQGITK